MVHFRSCRYAPTRDGRTQDEAGRLGRGGKRLVDLLWYGKGSYAELRSITKLEPFGVPHPGRAIVWHLAEVEQRELQFGLVPPEDPGFRRAVVDSDSAAVDDESRGISLPEAVSCGTVSCQFKRLGPDRARNQGLAYGS